MLKYEVLTWKVKLREALDKLDRNTADNALVEAIQMAYEALDQLELYLDFNPSSI